MAKKTRLQRLPKLNQRATQKDNLKKRKRDNERRRRGGQVSGSRQDHNKSRRFSQSGRAPPRVSSRSLPYPRHSCTRHLELDDVPRYADQALRNSRARPNYDVGGTSLYAGAAYGQSVGWLFAIILQLLLCTQDLPFYCALVSLLINCCGYFLELVELQKQVMVGHLRGSYGYDRDVGYGRSSVAGAGVGGVYSSGYGDSSIPGRTDTVGSSNSSLYPSQTSGAGYLPCHGFGSYY